MNFAIIEKSKVTAIIGIFPSNWQQFEEVVICNDNVQVGADYILGKFYRDGKLVKSSIEIFLERQNLENSATLIDEMTSLCKQMVGEQ